MVRLLKMLFSTITQRVCMIIKAIDRQILPRMKQSSLPRHRFKGKWKDKKAIAKPKWKKCMDMETRKMRLLSQSILESENTRRGTNEAKTIQGQGRTRKRDLAAGTQKHFRTESHPKHHKKRTTGAMGSQSRTRSINRTHSMITSSQNFIMQPSLTTSNQQ